MAAISPALGRDQAFQRAHYAGNQEQLQCGDQYGFGDLARIARGLGNAQRLHNGNHAMVGQPSNGGRPQLGQ